MATNETNISFYLQCSRIHIFVNALREIGCPSYICFMISENGRKLVLTPYPKKDYHSHRVPQRVYKGDGGMEVSSLGLCRIIASLNEWNLHYSYRIPGIIYPREKICVFALDQAERIVRR